MKLATQIDGAFGSHVYSAVLSSSRSPVGLYGPAAAPALTGPQFRWKIQEFFGSDSSAGILRLVMCGKERIALIRDR